ncbi:MAG: XRE family transcriptional regulator [Pseudomonadota bacterium]
MNLGSLLRWHRKQHKLTLRAVAEKVGVSEGFMSQVENNVKSPSLDTLIKIGEAIGVEAGELLNQLKDKEQQFPIRRAEWDDIDIPHTGFATRRFCAPQDRSVIDSAILIIEPGKSIPVRKNLKNGQEILCVLQGRLELVQGERVVELQVGDAIHFWSEPQKQRITNLGQELAVALWVGTL